MEILQIKILDPNGNQVGDGQLVTEDEAIAILDKLPPGYTIEEV